MCYLCTKDNPFQPVNGASTIRRKRERALEIKELLQEAGEKGTCDYGEVVVQALRSEQYKLSREM